MTNSFFIHILEPIAKSVAHYGARNAFFIGGTAHSYEEFAGRIAAIRTAIAANPGKNQIWGLALHDDLDTYASIIALWMEGKAYVPLQGSQPLDRNLGIIAQVELDRIIDTAADSPFGNFTVINPSELPSSEFNQAYAPADDNALAYILFTSGSTGVPKGVPISRGNLAAFVQAFWDMGYEIGPEDRVLQCFNLTFDLSVMSYLIPLLRGACVYTVPADVVKTWYICRLMSEQRLTVALMTPSTIQYLRPYFDEFTFPDMRYSLFCGEALPLDTTEGWARCLPNAIIDNVYGPTEDTIFCTYYRFLRDADNKAHNGVLSIGKSMTSGRIIIVDDAGKETAPGEVGELCLAGGQLTAGYWKNPQKDAEVFWMAADGTRFYRTGDLCFSDDDGDVLFVGRKDAQVKIQGFRVELGEIEVNAKQYFTDGTMLIAMAFENADALTEIALFVQSAKDETRELEVFLRTKLPAYMVPSRYIFMEKFPVNKSEKIDRAALKKLLNNE